MNEIRQYAHGCHWCRELIHTRPTGVWVHGLNRVDCNPPGHGHIAEPVRVEPTTDNWKDPKPYVSPDGHSARDDTQWAFWHRRPRTRDQYEAARAAATRTSEETK